MKSARTNVLAGFLSPLLLSLVLQGCAQPSDIPPDGEAVCGDAIVDAQEQCDDGNLDDGDGCSALCEIEEGEELTEAEKIDGYIRSLDPVPTEPASEVVNSESPAEVTPDGNYSCSAQNLTQVVPLSSISVLSDGTSSLFPGALLRGDSLYTGQFAEVAFARKPMTYSLSVQDGTSAPRSATMQNPTLSEFRDTIGAILEQTQLNNVPIRAQVKIQEIRSEQELEIALGFNVDTATVDVAGQFDFNSQQIQSRFLVTVDASFFTADVDAIPNPSNLFADSVSFKEVQQKFDDQNPPVYVSSITYGTRFYIAVESSFSSEEMEAALEASFNGVAVDADGEVTVSTRDIVQNSTINFVAVGASQQQLDLLDAALNAEDRLAALRSFATNPLVFNAANIGSPLTFTMKHVADNSLAALAFSGTFDALTCDRISQNIQVTLKQISVQNAADGGIGAGDVLELYGTIVASGALLPGNVGSIFNFPDNQFISLSNTNPFVANGAQFQKIVRINPQQASPQVPITANLFEDDGTGQDDDAIPQGVLSINENSEGFSGEDGSLIGRGFSGEYDLFIPSADGNFTITVEVKPVP